MSVCLRAVAPDDQTALRGWESAVSGEMSRTRPLDAAADRHDPAAGLFWYVIVADGRDVGSVWIELPPQPVGAAASPAETAEPAAAVLGILIGDPADRGRGVGTAAVGLAVAAFREARPELPIVLRVRTTNAAAIACYRRAGFVITGDGLKTVPSGETIPFYRMSRSGGTA